MTPPGSDNTGQQDHISNSAAACTVAYCRGGHAPGDLHDIPPCLKTCGPIRPGLGREHDAACPNAVWRRP